jgi:hypothetical protein
MARSRLLRLAGFFLLLIGISALIPGITSSDGLVFQANTWRALLWLLAALFAIRASRNRKGITRDLLRLSGAVILLLALIDATAGGQTVFWGIASNPADGWVDGLAGLAFLGASFLPTVSL